MDDVLDILHKIAFDIEDEKLRDLTNQLRKQTEYIYLLGQRQTKLAELFNKTATEETARRKRIISLMERNKQLLEGQADATEKVILTNKKFNQELIKEQGLIGALNSKLQILEQRRKRATTPEDVRRYSQLMAAERKKLDRLTNVSPKAGMMPGNLGAMSRMLPAIGGAFSMVTLGKQIFDVTKRFEGYNTTLKNAYGSSIKAAGAFDKIQKFAAKTPYGVDELTSSFIKLKNRGFDPTTAEMTKMGDLAASQGKSFDQYTEALLDAQTGEFERLKEFGIKAKTTGDDVTFAFKGIEKQVKKTDQEAIRNAIISFGELQGVTGGMAAQSKTLEGQLSNLGDTWDMVFNEIGGSSSSILGELIGLMGDLSDSFLDIIKNSPADELREQQTEITALISGIASLNGEEQIRSRMISELTAKYPELVRGINLEKASSEELMQVLSGINAGYQRRIQLAELTSRKEVAASKTKKAFDQTADILTDPRVQTALQKVNKATGQDFVKQFNEATSNLEKAQVLSRANDAAARKGKMFFVGFRSLQWVSNNIEEYTQTAKEQMNIQINEERQALKERERMQARYESLKRKAQKTSAELAEYNTLDLEFGSNEINPSKPNVSSTAKKKKEKKTKTPQEIALEKINEAEKKALAEAEKRNADYIAQQNKFLQNKEISELQHQKRLERNEILHQSTKLNISIKYNRQRVNYQKGADLAESKSEIAQSESELTTLAVEVQQKAEAEMRAAMDTFNQLNEDILNASDDTFKKEMEMLEKQHTQRLRKIEEDRKRESDAQIAALESGQTAIALVHATNIQNLNRLEEAENEKHRNEKVQKELKHELDLNSRKLELQLAALETFSEQQRKAVNDQLAITEARNAKELAILEEKGKRLDEIQRKQELSRRFLEYRSAERDLQILREKAIKLTGEQRRIKDEEVQIQQGKVDEIAKSIQRETEVRSLTKDDYVAMAETAAQAAQAIISAFEAQANSEIQIRERRVQRAQEIADRGNAEALQEEERRLDQAMKVRERFAKQQVALNLVMQASQIALAIANAAGQTGVGAIVAIPAVLLAIAAGFASIKSLQSTDAFKDGVIHYQGKGTGTSDSNLVRISRGESVITAEGTRKNAEILKEINDGKTIKPLNFTGVVHRQDSTNYDFKRMEQRLESLENAILAKPATAVSIDKDGIAVITEEYSTRQRKRDRL